MNKLNVLVLFGGVSTEHEVSIISGIQVLSALDKNKYNVIPIYVTKKGKWVRGDETFFDVKTFKNLDKFERNKSYFISPDRSINYLVTEGLRILKGKEKIDIAIPVFHGRFGEDGGIQGLFEVAGLAYVGSGVTASAIGMDKMLTKRVAESIMVPVLKGNWVSKDSTENAMDGLKFPVYVKPVHLGSSIGITKARDKKELNNALEVAFFYDSKILVEQGLESAKEVNISLIGNNPYEFSLCEMPVATSSILTFKDKYLSEGRESHGMASLKRILPAPIKKETEEKIQKYASRFFSEIGGEGIVRMDFILSNDEKHVYLNEINTIPGSLSYYLWKDRGVNFTKLLDKLINFGLERHERKQKLNTTFESNILESFRGAKASKY